MTLVRDGRWSVGIGCGPVRAPLPESSRAGAGAAFQHARRAVERAKGVAEHLAVEGPSVEAADAEAGLRLLANLLQRRTPEGWETVDRMKRASTQSEVAAQLKVTKQAVSQRLTTANWDLELAARALVSHLLVAADGKERVA